MLRYEILRWTEGRNARTVGLLASSADTLKWTDYYGQDETENAPGDTLETYRVYRYTVRKLNLFNEMTPPSDTVSAFCNRPPRITAHEVKSEDGRLVIELRWTRPHPNLFRSGFTTLVRIFSDSTTGEFVTETIADDDTVFTYRNVALGRNSIFQVLEILNHDPQARRSAWSQPYTVSFRNLDLDVLAQPRGRIFAHWGTSFVDSLRVSRFQLVRTAAGDTFDLMLSNRQSSYMDFSGTLVNGRLYRYSVYALDSLDHVVAAEVKEEVCDRGSAYIPDINPFGLRYFNSDSIDVSWHWNPAPVEAGVPGTVVPVTGTRGAVSCRLQVSVSRDFPSDPDQTLTQGPFPADPENRSRRVPIPDLSNIENARIYFRITASDPWGNPVESLWSSDFYPVQTVIFDPVPPRQVTDVAFNSVTAFYASPDSVVRRLAWSGVGVEFPAGSAGELERSDRQRGRVSNCTGARTTGPRSSSPSIRRSRGGARPMHGRTRRRTRKPVTASCPWTAPGTGPPAAGTRRRSGSPRPRRPNRRENARAPGSRWPEARPSMSWKSPWTSGISGTRTR